ncbi:2-iminobutanoate/2-iminopropanoate deaminase [Pacificibacter maritimus]|uniref:2-iminobutanoate/2-iminopropanoate deaminase n=1 Tax=Pacificibacter maritimus TaxID=762213 RepID=A0A3N4TWL9_9RHOB|nr:RidA family protein [Pacificibacter maritimus]RPE62936.1 2-iminobutanoate/2-iminopropanoate deaminase [Pacificibacter maritimus]
MPHLTPAYRDGETLYLSGALGFGSDGQISGDITEQTQKTLENLEAVLKDNGVDRNSVMRCGVYLTDTANFAAFDAAYAAFFGDHLPARSTIICGLALDTALIEIDVIAKG